MARRGPAMLRWAALSLAGIGVVAVLAVAAVYALGEQRLRKRFDDVSVQPLRVTGAGDAAEGARLVRVLGCVACHGAALSGADFYGIAAPNLTRVVRGYDRDRFARLLRTGVRADGTSVTWAMPSDFLAQLADDQIAALHAYIVSLPAAKDSAGPRRFGLRERYGLLNGELFLAAEVSRPEQPPAVAPKPGEAGFGAYFTSVACAECHGFDLGGGEDSPPLALAAQSYTLEAFTHFMKTGESVGGMKDLFMSGVARGRFHYMTHGEIAALHTYLTGLPAE